MSGGDQDVSIMNNTATETMTPEQIAQILIKASSAFDAVLRKLDPMLLSDIRQGLLDHLGPLATARQALTSSGSDGMDESVRYGLLRACDFILGAIRNFADEEDLQAAYISALRAARKHCRALEALYPLCGAFPEVSQYFLEPGATALPPADQFTGGETGIIHVGENRNLHARGGYSLYIPEVYTPERDWPLVVALHGGYSHGRDFLWTWLAHARSRGLVVLAPTAQAMTWSITDVEVDRRLLNHHLEEVCTRFSIDRSRMLLTGMSDGGTFALALGLSENSPYSAIAPVSCALPPVNLHWAEGKRILWVHGAQDWIFPVVRTIQACRYLQQSGADIRLKVIEDLSHTYPREENDTILQWWEKSNAAG